MASDGGRSHEGRGGKIKIEKRRLSTENEGEGVEQGK
jgi:hypothetical protein